MADQDQSLPFADLRQEDVRPGEGTDGSGGAALKIFLIADIRGYTRFTQDRIHVESARVHNYQNNPATGVLIDQLWVR